MVENNLGIIKNILNCVIVFQNNQQGKLNFQSNCKLVIKLFLIVNISQYKWVAVFYF